MFFERRASNSYLLMRRALSGVCGDAHVAK